jgi:hypothetical protein
MPKIPDKLLLKLACEFDLGPEPLLNGRPFWWRYYSDSKHMHTVRVRNMGNNLWAIIGAYGCLNKRGEWEYQGMSSDRDDDFYNRCRYGSFQEAIHYYCRWKKVIAIYCKRKYEAAGLKLASDMPMQDYEKVVINYEDIPPETLRF